MNLSRRDCGAGLGLIAIHLACALPAILAERLGPKAFDHRFFHLPLVREWSAGWPLVDLRDYNSATGPLYHWLLAGAAQVVGTGSGAQTSTPLQLVNALIGALVALVAFRFLRVALTTRVAFIAALPLALSPYVLGNSIWLMTDNLSILFLALALGSAAFGTARGRVLKEGFFAALATATRQINPWILGPITIGALLRGEGLRRPMLQLGFAIALTCLTLGGFILLWGGLVPPRFRELHAAGVNPAAIGFALTLTAAYGAPFLLASRRGLRDLFASPRLVLLVALAGALLASIGPSFASLEAGRNGGWVWRSVAVLPTIADRSLLILLGGALGALLLAALQLEARRAGRAGEGIVLLVGFASFTAAHAANSQIFQRYYDPMVLLTLLWLAACGVAPLARAERARVIAFALVAAGQGLFALVTL